MSLEGAREILERMTFKAQGLFLAWILDVRPNLWGGF